MSWRDSLQPASFRGASFGVVDTETVIGRRTVLHEYPLRDDPYAEDLGRKAREFTVHAFVIGDDYISARDALVAALEDSSAGTLIHPTLGAMSVVPISSRLNFKNTEGGIEYFELKFVEAGSNSFPSASLDTSSFSSLMADDGISSFMETFSQLYSVNNFPDFLANNATDLLIGSGQGAAGSIIPDSSSFTGILSNILQNKAITDSILPFGEIPIGDLAEADPTSAINYSDLLTNLSDFNSDTPTLVTMPAPEPTTSIIGAIPTTQPPLPIAVSITNLIVQLTQVYPNNPGMVIIAQSQLFNTFGTNLPSIPLTTTSRIQEALNQQQLIDLVKNTSLVEMVRATSVMAWSSRQDALSTLNQVQVLMGPQLLYLADNGFDDSYKALNNARIAMVKDINTRSSTLKNVKYVKINYPMPALVFAYKQYGDASQDSDVIARNKVRNPVFIPAQSNLEVLV